jgi:hypothetical protein
MKLPTTPWVSEMTLPDRAAPVMEVIAEDRAREREDREDFEDKARGKLAAKEIVDKADEDFARRAGQPCRPEQPKWSRASREQGRSKFSGNGAVRGNRLVDLAWPRILGSGSAV